MKDRSLDLGNMEKIIKSSLKILNRQGKKGISDFFTKINLSLLTGLVIAAGILIRKEVIMIQTEIVKEIVRLQAATAYTGEFKKLKINFDEFFDANLTKYVTKIVK